MRLPTLSQSLLVGAFVASLAATANGQLLRPPPVFGPIPAGGIPLEPSDEFRVMPIGDSITWGDFSTGGYRAPLYTRVENELAPIDFVGSAAPYSDPAVLEDWHHEGHPGWTIGDLIAFPGDESTPPSTIETLLTNFDPATLLLHIGTNNLLIGQTPEEALVELNALLTRIYATAPTVQVILAQIIPLIPPLDNGPVIAFNAAIPAMADGFAQAGFRIDVVDMYTAFRTDPNWLGLYVDGVHPNQDGYDRMADVWYDAMKVSDPFNPPIAPAPFIQTNFESVQSGSFDALKGDLIAAGSKTLASVEHAGYSGTADEPITALNDGWAKANSKATSDAVDESWTSTFRLDLTDAPRGYDIELIRTINHPSWTTGAQSYRVQVERAGMPGVFIDVGSFRYSYSAVPFATQAGGSGMVELRSQAGVLARSVSAIRFVFRPDPGHNATTSYVEIDVVGEPSIPVFDPPTGLSYRPLTP